MTNGNDLIAPRDGEGEREYKLSDGTVASIPFAVEKGLTKREYFAAMAMQGMLTNHEMLSMLAQKYADTPDILMEVVVGRIATKHADALIEALNKDK